MPEKLLFYESERAHSFSVRLACQFDLETALLIQHFRHYVRLHRTAGRNYHDGRTWNYNSVADLLKEMPYMSVRKIETRLKKLVDAGVLLSEPLRAYEWNRTNWYAFVDEVALFGSAPEEPDDERGYVVDAEHRGASPIPQNGGIDSHAKGGTDHRKTGTSSYTTSNTTLDPQYAPDADAPEIDEPVDGGGDVEVFTVDADEPSAQPDADAKDAPPPPTPPPPAVVVVDGTEYADVARKPSGVPEPGALFPPNSWQYLGAAWLYQKLLDMESSHVVTLEGKGMRERALQRWARHLDDPVRLDGLNPAEYPLMLSWLLGSWWASSGNFHTPAKLREKKGEVYRWQQWLDASRAARRDEAETADKKARGRNSGSDPSVFDRLRQRADAARAAKSNPE